MDAPVWSPDGSRIAVRVSRGYGDSLGGVWIASPERLLRRLTQGWEFVPVGWTEDGERVFLVKGARPEVYAVSVRGGAPTQVSTLPFESPDWTGLSLCANGNRALYTHFSDRRDLWLVEPLEGQGRDW
jgi:hypothetical protein